MKAMSELWPRMRGRSLNPGKLTSKVYPILRFAILVTLSYQLLYPLLYMISMAIREPAQAADPSVVWIPKSVTLQNFADVMKVMDFGNVMRVSLTIGIGCGILDVAICALTGYGFARFRFRGCNLLFGMVIFTLIVPPQTIMLPLYSMMRYFDGFGTLKLLSMFTDLPESINLIGNPLTLFLPSALGQGYRAGLYIFMFRQVFREMSPALEDAAYIDGCGPMRTFARIMLPNAKNTIITTFLFSFVWHWNEYYLTKMMMGSERNAAVALSMLRMNLASLTNVQVESNPLVILTRIQAGCLLLIAPLLIIYIVTQRYFTDSIEHSGVK